jgi:DNA segregation ATPase FtsK/SpoIIIE-like protein
VTLDEQLAHFDRRAEQAYARCVREMKERRESIIAEARARIIAGYELYEAVGFTWPYAQLRDARLEEYADAVNYELMSLYQGWR